MSPSRTRSRRPSWSSPDSAPRGKSPTGRRRHFRPARVRRLRRLPRPLPGQPLPSRGFGRCSTPGRRPRPIASKPAFVRGVKMLGDRGLSFDLCLRNDQLEIGRRLDRAVPWHPLRPQPLRQPARRPERPRRLATGARQDRRPQGPRRSSARFPASTPTSRPTNGPPSGWPRSSDRSLTCSAGTE